MTNTKIENAALTAVEDHQPLLTQNMFAAVTTKRRRDVSEEALEIFSTDGPGVQFWLTSQDDGFHGHCVQVSVPAGRALLINLYHKIDPGTGRVREYKANVDHDCLFQPMWMLGREIGYLWARNEADPVDSIRLSIINPDKPDQPFIIEMLKSETLTEVTMLSEQSEENQLIIEQYRLPS